MAGQTPNHSMTHVILVGVPPSVSFMRCQEVAALPCAAGSAQIFVRKNTSAFNVLYSYIHRIYTQHCVNRYLGANAYSAYALIKFIRSRAAANFQRIGATHATALHSMRTSDYHDIDVCTYTSAEMYQSCRLPATMSWMNNATNGKDNNIRDTRLAPRNSVSRPITLWVSTCSMQNVMCDGVRSLLVCVI